MSASRSHQSLGLCVVGTALGWLASASVAAAQSENIANLAQALAELRADVEELSDTLASEKAELQDELRTLARQKTELALELDRERMRLQKTRMAIAEKRDTVAKEKRSAEALVPVFEKTAAALRVYITDGLPFRVPERIAELEKLEHQLESGLLTPQQAIARLWTMVEDEQRMTRDSGLFQQTIQVNGERQLADVVRLGMVELYFKTSDDLVGHVRQSDGVWSYEALASDADVKLVNALFDSFQKQIRVGYFRLPNTLQVGQ